MNNREIDDLRQIGRELWELFNSIKLSELDKLKSKIKEFNFYMINMEPMKNERRNN